MTDINPMRKLSYIAIILLLSAAPLEAARQYRCNEMIQYRPCEQKMDESTREQDGTGSAGGESGKRQLQTNTARVFDDSFEALSEVEGIWRGKVAGKGFVKLNLHIFRNGHQIERRYMGGVELDGNSTYFAFKSSLPEGENWTWVIRAGL